MRCDWLTPSGSVNGHPAMDDAWELGHGNRDYDPVIAVLIATHGPAYRNAGAAITFLADGRFAGTISSGCIEADLALRAAELRANPKAGPQMLRYGDGSPFFDLRLPCGGALDVMIFVLRDFEILSEIQHGRAAREGIALQIDAEGRLSSGPLRQTGYSNGIMTIGFGSALSFIIFGAGPEATVFSSILGALGYNHLLLSHDQATLDAASSLNCRSSKFDNIHDIDRLIFDAHTAVILFYHDHDYEPEILARVTESDAFYIGAQGSRATHQSRLLRLEEIGVPARARERVRGPIGLIPSSRDPRELAISVLAEIVSLTPERAMTSIAETHQSHLT